jgi:hypothetical protein
MIKVNTGLTCGCCGMGFRTWEGYEDQDQDFGFGICAPCQADNEVYHRREAQKLIDTVKTGLKDENLEKYESWDWDKQLSFAMQMLDKGAIKYCIKPV